MAIVMLPRIEKATAVTAAGLLLAWVVVLVGGGVEVVPPWEGK